MEPLVSIVISNHNGKELLQSCLASLQKLDYPHYEVIVVDAGSADGAPEMVESCFPDVRLIRAPLIGIGEALNIGIRSAKGEIIAFDFNNDEEASPGWLRTLVSVLNSSSDIGIVAGTRLVHGSSGIVDDAGGKISFFGHFSTMDRGTRYSELPKDPREAELVTAPVVKREVFDKIGLCDEVYYIYGEDADFCLRARKAGYRILQVPGAVSYHRESRTLTRYSPRALYFERRALIRCALKHFSLPKALLCLGSVIIHIAAEFIAVLPPVRAVASHTRFGHRVGMVTFAHFRVSLNAVAWNIANLPSTLRARRHQNEI